MTNPIKPIIDNLDARKKALKKTRHTATPGIVETHIMLNGYQRLGVNKKTSLEHLAKLKRLINKTTT